MNQTLKPDYLFEVSWEVCNTLSGIHTALMTKSPTVFNDLENNYILIGPDLRKDAYINSEFVEDTGLLKNWKKKAASEGLIFRIGRWNIPSKPLVILVDFSTFISSKNDIFKDFWERYKLDSISGQWDYVEPAIFGYVVGKVIENFVKYNTASHDKIVAHFHEWMSATGVLYLRSYAPYIATVFTTHSTSVGRALAAKQVPFYSNLDTYDADNTAKEMGIEAKQSLEKIAANQADCFTTDSHITARECAQFLKKKVDIVTPNGFDEIYLPNQDTEKKKKEIRDKFIHIAEALFDYPLSSDIKIVLTSGRYEFSNKGIDVFIDALASLKNDPNLKSEILAYIFVAANNYGPKKGLINRMEHTDDHAEVKGKYLTHSLHDSEYDTILNKIKEVGLENEEETKIKVVYVPAYINGNDGIFNDSFYNVLLGCDLTIFPSYYEPWGYMPLESLSLGVPTVTTSLTGFGTWMRDSGIDLNQAVRIIERTDSNYQEVVKEVAEKIIEYASYDEKQMLEEKKNAAKISKSIMWDQLIKHYHEAYHIALKKVDQIPEKMTKDFRSELDTSGRVYKSNKPVWKAFNVHTNLPDFLSGLEELAYNLWWSWDYEATEMFEMIEPNVWKQAHYNPIQLLQEVSYERLKELEQDKEFREKYAHVWQKFKDYLSKKPAPNSPKIAYFSMEYGLNNTLKTFSGGLGVLAGDYLKEASDSLVDIVGIGFLYRYGYFKQQISLKGEQLSTYEPQDFANLPIRPVEDSKGKWIHIQLTLPGRTVFARLWQVNVGRIKLYLMDANILENNHDDRELTHKLYGGDVEHRLKQEMLLGIGGIRALNSLKIEPDLYHCNEGHAAFIGIERISKLMNEKNFTFNESLEIVKVSSLFTTHTPVPAGHDTFTEDMMLVYMGKYPDRLKITWDEFMDLGRSKQGDKTEKFSMSNLAANTCQEINGVSKLHGEVTRDMFQNMWDGYYPDELHIGYVTNGVHYATWTAKEWQLLYEKEFGKKFLENLPDKNNWKAIHNVPDKTIWEIRQKMKKNLVNYIKEYLTYEWIKRFADPKKIVKIRKTINENKLTIGFARRFATYKRANLLFKDLHRLSQIVNHPEYPIQFIFAGKAHPNDGGGQELIRLVNEVASHEDFIGKVIFLPEYDMHLASVLVPGVDVWLNTPTRPMEASGTSGMKAVMNGVMNLSVLDGWWVEGYKANAGWALPQEQTYDNLDFQNELDAEIVYSLLENEIAPLYYEKNEEGLPADWIKRIKFTISDIAPDFTTTRMINDYQSRFYSKMFERTKKMRENEYEMAKKIASWKKKVSRSWDNLEVISVKVKDFDKDHIVIGKSYPVEVVLDLNELATHQPGVEILITRRLADGKIVIDAIKELSLKKIEDGVATYVGEIIPSKPGIYHYGIRVFPVNEDLPHRQDFPYLKWI